MLGEEMENLLLAAEKDARLRGHEYLCVEHLLFRLVDEESVRKMLNSCGADIGRIKERLEKYFTERLESYPNSMPQQTLAFERVVERAILHVQYSSATQLTFCDLLVSILAENESFAVYVLRQEGVERFTVLELLTAQTKPERRPVKNKKALGNTSGTTSGNRLGDTNVGPVDGQNPIHGMTPEHTSNQGEHSWHGVDSVWRGEPTLGSSMSYANYGDDTEDTGDANKALLAKYTCDLVEKARNGEIDPLVGREQELRRIMEILTRRQKNNPLLVGDQGVGKTAIVEGLALRVSSEDVPFVLKGLNLYALDLGSLLAGTRYRGDFEERLKEVLAALAGIPKAVLVIDEIHNIVGAGSVSGTSLDLASLLKPALQGGKLRCIGCTTYSDFRKIMEKDSALVRRFLKVDVHEPTADEALSILKGLKVQFEDFHGVKYADKALKTAVSLSARYIKDRYLPDKAIDVIDEAAAAVVLSSSSGSRVIAGKRYAVSMRNIEDTVARIASVPAENVNTNERDKLEKLPEMLKGVVFGQDDAIDHLVRSICRSRAGLKADNKTVGAFLFVGPTGVGKTEVARQLARVLGVELVRFDMSEYMEKHSVARLIGTPPGYVGFDQGGLLTDAIIKAPHSVVLFDELEKAHPDVYNILLQVMDNASLTDHNGRKAHFSNAIIVMTSNVGSENIHGNTIGFMGGAQSGDQGAVNKAFRPEFRNRLDGIIKFKSLADEVILRIVDKFIEELAERLVARKITLAIEPEVRDWFARTGYSSEYGARAIGRLIQDRLTNILAEKLLFTDVKEGDSLRVKLVGVEEDAKIVIE